MLVAALRTFSEIILLFTARLKKLDIRIVILKSNRPHLPVLANILASTATLKTFKIRGSQGRVHISSKIGVSVNRRRFAGQPEAIENTAFLAGAIIEMTAETICHKLQNALLSLEFSWNWRQLQSAEVCSS